MLTTKYIISALKSMLQDQYPAWKIYTNLAPASAARPNLLIEPIALETADVNSSLIQRTELFRITITDETDDYQTGDPDHLQEIQEEIFSLFDSGVLQVENRHIKARASYGKFGDEAASAISGREQDKAFLDLRFEYMEERPATQEGLPLIETVATNIQPKG